MAGHDLVRPFVNAVLARAGFGALARRATHQKPVFQRSGMLAQFRCICFVFVGLGRRVCGGCHGHPCHQQRLRWQRFNGRRSHAWRFAHGRHVFHIGLLQCERLF